VSNYKLNADDKQEFEDWWDDNHCEGDTSRRDGEAEYAWAKTAFEYGVQYALGQLATTSGLRTEHEEIIVGLTRQAVLLQERAEAAEELACRRGEALMNLRKQKDTTEEGLELDKLREQKVNLLLAVGALADVLNMEVL
jgi:hypothetical protein